MNRYPFNNFGMGPPKNHSCNIWSTLMTDEGQIQVTPAHPFRINLGFDQFSSCIHKMCLFGKTCALCYRLRRRQYLQYTRGCGLPSSQFWTPMGRLWWFRRQVFCEDLRHRVPVWRTGLWQWWIGVLRPKPLWPRRSMRRLPHVQAGNPDDSWAKRVLPRMGQGVFRISG